VVVRQEKGVWGGRVDLGAVQYQCTGKGGGGGGARRRGGSVGFLASHEKERKAERRGWEPGSDSAGWWGVAIGQG